MSSSPKKTVLKSSDGETFEVEMAVAIKSQTIKHMIIKQYMLEFNEATVALPPLSRNIEDKEAVSLQSQYIEHLVHVNEVLTLQSQSIIEHIINDKKDLTIIEHMMNQVKEAVAGESQTINHMIIEDDNELLLSRTIERMIKDIEYIIEYVDEVKEAAHHAQSRTIIEFIIKDVVKVKKAVARQSRTIEYVNEVKGGAALTIEHLIEVKEAVALQSRDVERVIEAVEALTLLPSQTGTAAGSRTIVIEPMIEVKKAVARDSQTIKHVIEDKEAMALLSQCMECMIEDIEYIIGYMNGDKEAVAKRKRGQIMIKDMIIKVKEGLALLSQNIEHMIGVRDFIPLPNVNSKTLAKVIEYCRKHVDEKPDQMWDKSFVNVDNGVLVDLAKAANYLKIDDLLDLILNTFADKIKRKPAEARKIFNIPKRPRKKFTDLLDEYLKYANMDPDEVVNLSVDEILENAEEEEDGNVTTQK